MVDAVLAQPSEDFAEIVLRPEWTVSLDYGEVTVRPDAVRVTDDGAVVERWKTGRVSKGEADKDEYALYHTAASELFEAYEVRAVTLADGEQVPLPMTDAKRKNRLKKYGEAIGAVAAGQFPADPSDRECPVCPFYFICPA
jgi:CRISPR/Cas system-associated exonuclease Cas4 (RecB family)